MSDYPRGNGPHEPDYFRQDIGSKLVGASIAVITLDIIFVSLRFVSRRLGRIKEGWDGVFIYPALVCNIATCALTWSMSI